MESKGFEFNVALLKYFWNNRERKIIYNPSGIMKQKFLFFYNLFAKINNKHCTFENLKAFKNGPVYYDIYKETKTKNLVYLEKLKVITPFQIDEEIAQVTLQLLYLYKNNMSTITHSFDLWSKVYNAFGTKDIKESDITKEDFDKATLLYNETKNVLKNYSIVFNKYDVPFIIDKGKKNYIVNNYYDELQFNTENKYPIYVTEENGELYFD